MAFCSDYLHTPCLWNLGYLHFKDYYTQHPENNNRLFNVTPEENETSKAAADSEEFQSTEGQIIPN